MLQHLESRMAAWRNHFFLKCETAALRYNDMPACLVIWYGDMFDWHACSICTTDGSQKHSFLREGWSAARLPSALPTSFLYTISLNQYVFLFFNTSMLALPTVVIARWLSEAWLLRALSKRVGSSSLALGPSSFRLTGWAVGRIWLMKSMNCLFTVWTDLSPLNRLLNESTSDLF